MRHLAGLGFFLLPVLGLAHHSTAYFSDEIRELEGVLTEVQWRNPHIALTIDVTNAQGEVEAWRLEANSIYNLLRSGVTEDDFRIGDRLEVTGRMSKRQERVLLTNAVITSSGESLIVWNNRGDAGEPELPDTVAENKGIFRVWSVPRPSGRSLHYPFSKVAIAARESWDMLDNFAIRCEPEGMPRIMVNPHPFEFTDHGDEISLRTELYDIVRTIHMDGSAPGPAQPLSHLGYSVGVWDGDALVVTSTHINWPYFDNIGTPQSEDVEIVERYTLSQDQRRLNYFITITDPGTFTEPATIDGHWLALGETLPVYDCQPYGTTGLPVE